MPIKCILRALHVVGKDRFTIGKLDRNKIAKNVKELDIKTAVIVAEAMDIIIGTLSNLLVLKLILTIGAF